MTDAVIYKSMKKHRRIFLVIEAFLVAVWIIYVIFNQSYLLNVIFGAVDLDEARFAQSTEKIAVGEPFELHRRDKTTIDDYTLKTRSYWQGDKYEFYAELGEVNRSVIKYTNKKTGTGSKSEENEVSAIMYEADISGTKVIIMAYPHQQIKSGDTVCGIFTELPLIVKHDLAKYSHIGADGQISKYMLDIRGIEMESEQFDLVFSFVLLVIIILLGIKLAFQFKNHLTTPTYRQLNKYGEPQEVEKMVESELKEGIREKKQIITENWIISEDTFKLKIVKNHRKHGSFKYTQ